MATETKKTPIAYATRPVFDANGSVIGYEKYNPITTGNAVVVKMGVKKERLNDAMIRMQLVLSAALADIDERLTAASM